MNIEVCLPSSATTKDKGDLLESLCKTMLEIQHYDVETEISKTGTELDLLCTHRANQRRIYVECKAYRDKKIDAPTIRQLIGTIPMMEVDEGWLITTSELTKGGSGLEDELKKKFRHLNTTIYTPKKIIDALISSRLIVGQPEVFFKSKFPIESFGEFTLLVTSYGYFWAGVILQSGTPKRVACIEAASGELIEDEELIAKLSNTDTSLSNLEFFKPNIIKILENSNQESSIEVISVQKGEEWNDYRPARPQDFVGRTKEINGIFELLKRMIDQDTDTRVFSITGNSGLGKSSLIIKLAEKSKNKHNKNKVFLNAVDMRAAKSHQYIYVALLKTLIEAQKKGFGSNTVKLQLTNHSHPLDSTSIQEYLKTVAEKKQIIVLIFDQFEELFSKPELFEIFNHAKTLLLDTASIKSNLCIGFAWKTDSTTPSEHPAYYLWQSLKDYRINYKLNPFSESESKAVLNKFEKEINEKIHTDLRHSLIVSSQGYPWLLKKLCIHIQDKITLGSKQDELLENKLDIASLFESDLSELSTQQAKTLKYVANRAPVDMVDTIDACGEQVVTGLINHRLIIKSGIMLNIYWDIFKEYLLTKTVPILSLRYLPSSDFNAIWSVSKHLSKNPISLSTLVKETKLSEGTVQNIATDLIIFGIANRENGYFTISQELEKNDLSKESILEVFREKFKKHIVTIHLKESSQANINLSILIELMKNLYNNNYADKTWRAYALRLSRWLEITGFLHNEKGSSNWYFKDLGTISDLSKKSGLNKVRTTIFFPRNSPQLVIKFYNNNIHKDVSQIKKDSSGIKSIEILKNFGLIENNRIIKVNELEKFMLEKSLKEESICLARDISSKATKPLTRKNLGIKIRDNLGLDWTDVTSESVGKKLGLWVEWLSKVS